jgi:hypothetical protein
MLSSVPQSFHDASPGHAKVSTSNLLVMTRWSDCWENLTARFRRYGENAALGGRDLEDALEVNRALRRNVVSHPPNGRGLQTESGYEIGAVKPGGSDQ